MTRQQLMTFCLSLPGAYEDHPFDDLTTQPREEDAMPVMRHRLNRKIFAILGFHKERWMVLLKCHPTEALILRDTFRDVEPGYHMNKEHWNTVYLEGDVPENEIHRQVMISYELTRPKGKRPPKIRQDS